MDMSHKFAVVETLEDRGKGGCVKCYTAVPTIWLQKDAYSVGDSDVDLSIGADFMKYPTKTSLRIENCRQKGQLLPADCEWDGMQCKIKSTWMELKTVSHIMFKYILIYTQTYIFLWRTKNKYMLYIITFLFFRRNITLRGIPTNLPIQMTKVMPWIPPLPPEVKFCCLQI